MDRFEAEAKKKKKKRVNRLVVVGLHNSDSNSSLLRPEHLNNFDDFNSSFPQN